ncbi:MAG: ribonuclease III [Anaerolineales bacterium]|nr:ribonuclease III [Anaerolineales bacterium]
MSLPLGASGFESPVDFAARLDIPFTDILLLSRALTHRSYLNEHPEALEDNERLEFLGDAVLDFLVGAWLYNHFPEMAEGDLTRLRSALVKTEQLAEFARQINLGNAMRLGRGEAQAGGADRPALLCGTFEALIGAIYLDLGMQAVEKFLQSMLKEASNDAIFSRKEQDPKSIFQEWAQSQGYGPPIYRTISTTGPDHDRLFEVEVWVGETRYGYGQGHSKQAATKAAARDALNTLDYY